MTDDPDKQTGLYSKYLVDRLNDPDGKHNACDFFVLDLKHDPIARGAALAYAEVARVMGYEQLANDLALQVARNIPRGTDD